MAEDHPHEDTHDGARSGARDDAPDAGGSRFLDALRARLGDDAVRTDPGERAPYEKGWRYGEGRALAIALPDSPRAVADVLALAHEHGVRVQPIGANTGVVGASNPDATGRQLVLSLERLQRVVEIDVVDRVAVVEAGLTLGRLNEELLAHGLCFPVDLGADPQIGGMIATNTGGTRLLRYGDVRDNLLGLEVALPDGTLVQRLQPLRKNNTGLEFAQLFVGTSGSFGVITRAALSLEPAPRQRATFLLAVDEGEPALELLGRLEGELGGFLSAFEAISAEALEVTLRHGSRVRDPFPDRRPAYVVLIEFATALAASRLDLGELALGALADAVESVDGLDPEAVLVDQDDAFWHLRHSITEAMRHEGTVLAFDLSVRRSQLARFSRVVRERLADHWPGVRVCDYGHWGDGGTHLNLVVDTSRPDAADLTPGSERWRALQDFVYVLCVEEFDGSFSAEHGVGPHNQRLYDRYVPQPVRSVSGVLKRHFDPHARLGTVRLGPGREEAEGRDA